MVPGECGGVTDVNWVILQNPENGSGLHFSYEDHESCNEPESLETGRVHARPVCMTGAQVSALRFSPAEAHDAWHDHELPKSKSRPIVVHVDTAHCGIGGVGGVTDAVWLGHKQ